MGNKKGLARHCEYLESKIRKKQCKIEEYCQQFNKAIDYAHKRLGFLENCVGGDVYQINQEIAIHQKYLSILEGKE